MILSAQMMVGAFQIQLWTASVSGCLGILENSFIKLFFNTLHKCLSEIIRRYLNHCTIQIKIIWRELLWLRSVNVL